MQGLLLESALPGGFSVGLQPTEVDAWARECKDY